MSTQAPFLKTTAFDFSFHQASMQEVLAWMEGCIARDRQPRFLCTLNAALIVWGQHDLFLRQSYLAADLTVVDSFVVYYALKLLGVPVPEPLEACQIMFQFIEKNHDKNVRLFFLGAKREVLEKAMANLKQKYPLIHIAGYHHGYFGEKEGSHIAEQIKASKADCLFVGMSSPLKEKFLQTYKERMQVPICLGVGGGIDILAGHYKHAPRWMHTLGFAWAYRLFSEPRRMFKRYLTTNTIFLWLFFKSWIRKSKLKKLDSGLRRNDEKGNPL